MSILWKLYNRNGKYPYPVTIGSPSTVCNDDIVNFLLITLRAIWTLSESQNLQIEANGSFRDSKKLNSYRIPENQPRFDNAAMMQSIYTGLICVVWWFFV